MSQQEEAREVTRTERTYWRVCDYPGCEVSSRKGDYLIEVRIAVHRDEEGGAEDVYDYCDDHIEAVADALVAAGSRAPIVAGWPEGAER